MSGFSRIYLSVGHVARSAVNLVGYRAFAIDRASPEKFLLDQKAKRQVGISNVGRAERAHQRQAPKVGNRYVVGRERRGRGQG